MLFSQSRKSARHGSGVHHDNISILLLTLLTGHIINHNNIKK